MNTRQPGRRPLLLAALALWGGAARAQPVDTQPLRLTQPLPATGAPARPVLTLAGPKGTRSLSVDDLERLPLYRVRTSTFWPDDDGTYEGPLLRDVVALVGLDQASHLRVRAVDGFSQRLPREDWTRWPVLLATRRDSRPMGTREKGPLRVIYPRDMDPQLHDATYRLRWVWLVNRIEAAPGS